MATGSGTGSPVAVGNYITDTDIDNWVTPISDAEKKAIIQQVEQMIEKVTHDIFYSKTETLVLDGNGKNRLFTKNRYKLLSVSSITVHGETMPTSYYTFDDNSVYMDTEDIIAWTALQSDHDSGLFQKGMNNIEITCTVGHSIVPPSIKQAAVILCRFENDSTLYSQYSNLESETFGDRTIKKEKFLTGVLEADRLLKAFINRKAVFGAI